MQAGRQHLAKCNFTLRSLLRSSTKGGAVWLASGWSEVAERVSARFQAGPVLAGTQERQPTARQSRDSRARQEAKICTAK